MYQTSPVTETRGFPNGRRETYRQPYDVLEAGYRLDVANIDRTGRASVRAALAGEYEARYPLGARLGKTAVVMAKFSWGRLDQIFIEVPAESLAPENAETTLANFNPDRFGYYAIDACDGAVYWPRRRRKAVRQ